MYPAAPALTYLKSLEELVKKTEARACGRVTAAVSNGAYADSRRCRCVQEMLHASTQSGQATTEADVAAMARFSACAMRQQDVKFIESIRAAIKTDSSPAATDWAARVDAAVERVRAQQLPLDERAHALVAEFRRMNRPQQSAWLNRNDFATVAISQMYSNLKKSLERSHAMTRRSAAAARAAAGGA